MPQIVCEYQTRSGGSPDRLSMAAAIGPLPGRFEAVIAKPALFRLAMMALGEVVNSDFQWKSEEEWAEELRAIIDPVVGIHTDGITFEGFSLDGSTCGWLHFSNEVFEVPTVRSAGCTNIDFSAKLSGFISTLSATRPITLSIGTGTGLKLKSDGTATRVHEKKIDLPAAWVQGFAEMHAALARCTVSIPLSRIDLLNIIRGMQSRKARPGSKRGIVFELNPGERTVARIQPWETRIKLKPAEGEITEATEWRVYGRRRLTLLQRLLPYVKSARLHLIGDSRPSFWDLDLGGARYILALSPWTARKFTHSIAESLRGARASDDEDAITDVAAFLAETELASYAEIAEALQRDEGEVRAVGQTLCRRGLAIAEPSASGLRWRPLHLIPFAELAEAGAGTVSREKNALRLIADGKLEVLSASEQEGLRHATARCQGSIEIYDLGLSLNDDGSFASASCTCKWMRRQGDSLKGGPCKHLLALREQIFQPSRKEMTND